jgi:hypothetical protein
MYYRKGNFCVHYALGSRPRNQHFLLLIQCDKSSNNRQGFNGVQKRVIYFKGMKIKENGKVGGLDQMVECLPSNLKALSSKKERRKKERERKKKKDKRRKKEGRRKEGKKEGRKIDTDMFLWPQWLTPVFLTTWEAEIRRIKGQGQPRKTVIRHPPPFPN